MICITIKFYPLLYDFNLISKLLNHIVSMKQPMKIQKILADINVKTVEPRQQSKLKGGGPYIIDMGCPPPIKDD